MHQFAFKFLKGILPSSTQYVANREVRPSILRRFERYIQIILSFGLFVVLRYSTNPFMCRKNEPIWNVCSMALSDTFASVHFLFISLLSTAVQMRIPGTLLARKTHENCGPTENSSRFLGGDLKALSWKHGFCTLLNHKAKSLKQGPVSHTLLFGFKVKYIIVSLAAHGIETNKDLKRFFFSFFVPGTSPLWQE